MNSTNSSYQENRTNVTESTTLFLVEGLSYSVKIPRPEYDVAEVITRGKRDGFAIRIETFPSTCRGIPMDSGDGCQGRDIGGPTYEYYNLNPDILSFNGTPEQIWDAMPSTMGVNYNLSFGGFTTSTEHLLLRVSTYTPRERKLMISISPLQTVDEDVARHEIIEELVARGILAEYQTITMDFGEGYDTRSIGVDA
jgi:hypothetical protein